METKVTELTREQITTCLSVLSQKQENLEARLKAIPTYYGNGNFELYDRTADRLSKVIDAIEALEQIRANQE